MSFMRRMNSFWVMTIGMSVGARASNDTRKLALSSSGSCAWNTFWSHEVAVQLAVETEHAVAAVFGGADVGVLSHRVGGVEHHAVAVLVGLVRVDEGLVFVDGEEFVVGVLQ